MSNMFKQPINDLLIAKHVYKLFEGTLMRYNWPWIKYTRKIFFVTFDYQNTRGKKNIVNIYYKYSNTFKIISLVYLRL